MNIILIGAQGSGKGTQAELLSKVIGAYHVASGDLFREAFEEHTELGLKAKAYVDRGELVPDEITVALVLGFIAQPDCAQGVILDGFPRTVAQARALDKGLQSVGRHIDRVVYLDVPADELLHRIAGRYICKAHQHVYNIHTHPPKVPGVCDLDGSELYQRSDDQSDAVQKRLDIFFHETIHLLDYYGNELKLVKVNGDQDANNVQEDIVKALQHGNDQNG